MSSLAHVLTTWEDVLARLRRMSVSWQGNPLSERDLNTYTEALVLCSLHLTDLSTRHDGIGTERELIGWATSVASTDVHAFGSFLSDAVNLLRHVAEPTTYSWFKRQLSKQYSFAGMALQPIKGVLDRFLSSPNHRDFYVCYQFLSFLTHLSLRDLDYDLENEYEEMEVYLHSLHYPEATLDSMNAIMREWMKDFSVTESNFIPSHGPGAVAELSASATMMDKYQYLGTDALISYVFSKFAGVDVETYYPFPSQEWERKSKVVFVPKSIKTRRTISKEPATLMYLQQGISRCIVDYIHNHRELSSHIDLRDQNGNARLAIESSLTHRFATVDLSSASDTVSTTLVKAVFRGTPLYPYLVALRSRTAVLPSGKEVELAKYAPMGSALCFPIESLIFACAVEFAVRRARAITGFFPEWRVYGDDIIVHDALFWEVVMVLESLGFILNHSKSFSSLHRFRESCGGEGYDGVRVTPMKISRRFVSVRDRITPSHAAIYEGLIDMANDAYFYQFPVLRSWIIRVLLGNSVAPPLFSGSCNGSIYSPWPDNYRATQSYNRRYQRMEIEVAGVRPTKRKTRWTERQEDARYFETLRLIAHNRATDDMFLPEHRILVPRGTGRPHVRTTRVEIPEFTVATRHPQIPGC